MFINAPLSHMISVWFPLIYNYLIYRFLLVISIDVQVGIDFNVLLLISVYTLI